MLKRTISEEQLEAFCQRRSIPLERIPGSDSRTPDYQITIGSERIVVEIKETSPNHEELESDRLLKQRGYGNATGGTPGDRVRKMIRSASAQLKARSNGAVPSIFVSVAAIASCVPARRAAKVDPFGRPALRVIGVLLTQRQHGIHTCRRARGDGASRKRDQ